MAVVRQPKEIPVAAAVERERRPPWWAKAAFSFVALLVTLLVLEFGVRVAFPQDLDFFAWQKIGRASSQPGLKYELIPNARNRSYIGVPVSVNSVGLRDREVQVPKPPGTVRILAVGDSITFGYGVRLEDTYEKVLERELGRSAPPGRRYEVVNAGVEALDLDNYLAFLRLRAPDLQPDLVIVGIALNDVRQYREESQPPPVAVKAGLSARASDLVRPMNGLLLGHSQLYLLGYMSLKSFLYRTGVLDINAQHGYDFLAVEPPSPRQERAWASTMVQLERIAALARARGYPLVLVVFPVEVQLGPASLDFYRREFRVALGPEALSGDPQRRLAAFGAAHGVPVVDLLPAFRRADAEALYLRNRSITHDPVHPNPRGHRIAGEEVYRVVAANADRLLPATR